MNNTKKETTNKYKWENSILSKWKREREESLREKLRSPFCLYETSKKKSDEQKSNRWLKRVCVLVLQRERPSAGLIFYYFLCGENGKSDEETSAKYIKGKFLYKL